MVDLIAVIAIDKAYDAANAAHVGGTHGDRCLAAVDAHGIVGIAHQSAYDATVANPVSHIARNGAIDRTAIDSAVYAVVGLLLPVVEQIAAQQSCIEALDAGTSRTEAHVSRLDDDVPDASTAGSEQSPAEVFFYAGFRIDAQTGNGLAIAVEIAVEGVLVIHTDGNPKAGITIHLSFLQVDVVAELEKLALESVVAHIDLVGQLGKTVGILNDIRVVLGARAAEAAVAVLVHFIPHPLPVVMPEIIGLCRHLHLGRQKQQGE